MANKYVCTSCGYAGKPIDIIKGSILIELVLWLLFILPGLIYSLWRLTSGRIKACPKCKKDSMIPADSPRGKELIG